MSKQRKLPFSHTAKERTRFLMDLNQHDRIKYNTLVGNEFLGFFVETYRSDGEEFIVTNNSLCVKTGRFEDRHLLNTKSITYMEHMPLTRKA